MIYKVRIEQSVTVEYNGGTSVAIIHSENSYGREETAVVQVENVGALVQALQDVQRLKYDEW